MNQIGFVTYHPCTSKVCYVLQNEETGVPTIIPTQQFTSPSVQQSKDGVLLWMKTKCTQTLNMIMIVTINIQLSWYNGYDCLIFIVDRYLRNFFSVPRGKFWDRSLSGSPGGYHPHPCSQAEVFAEGQHSRIVTCLGPNWHL